MMALAAPLLIAGTAIQGVAAIQQGNTANAVAKAQAQQGIYAADAQQQQDEIAAENTEIQAKQDQSNRLADLARTVGTIRATLSSRNLDLSSPSAAALEDAANTYAQRDISNARFNAMQTASSYRTAGATAVQQAGIQAQITRAQGAAAAMAGYTSAAGSLFKAASYANSYYGGKG